ncbi:MAG TPA: restriction endonuclease-like protein, partial [Methanocorpusculum sp.]|nr:restriction endonuclease-like protein [Methanocorpusculum sp.]
EVFPSKIGYKDDYKAIVADVTAEVYNLVFDFLKKTYDSFDISSNKQSSPVEFFAIIRKIYDEFLSAADMVIAKPHHVLETEHVVLPNHKIKRTDNKTLRWIEKHPDQTMRSGDRVLVERALAVKKYVTYDTKENRLTKYMLQSTVKRLENFRRQYLKLSRDTDLAMVDTIDAMIKGIQRRYNTGFLKEVEAAPANSGMSLVFSMAPGYRDLYRCYLLLQHGLSVTGSVFNVSVKDLAVLYEYWCFIKLNSLMKQRYELLSQDIIKVAGNGLFVSLIKGQRSRVRYRNPENGEVITLSYNPKEISGATVPQKPDNVLSLKKKGAKVDYEYVFDAKYKINPALEGSLYQKMYGTPGPQEEDINTMHRYRDAIVYQSDASPFERTMFGAYVLFPYRNQEEYRNHRFYQSIEQVNIGGLPFLPSTTELVTEMLDELISDSPESAFERATLPTGIEDRLAKVDWSSRDVLIGTLRSNAQLQTCLEKKFYYIPQKLVSDTDLPIHYVALFQTPRIFSNNAGIHYYGEVLRSALVRRKNIREIPMRNGADPEELYYRFVIRKWIPLERPILPKESGFVREYTNMFLLENAEYVPELLLRSEEEYRFYTELKRRTGTALEDNESAAGFELGDIKVLFDDGQIQVYRDGKAAGNCSITEFSR